MLFVLLTVFLLNCFPACASSVARVDLSWCLLYHPDWKDLSIETGRPWLQGGQISAQRSKALIQSARNVEKTLQAHSAAREDLARRLFDLRQEVQDGLAYQKQAAAQRRRFEAKWQKRFAQARQEGLQYLGSPTKGREVLMDMLFEIVQTAYEVQAESKPGLLIWTLSDKPRIQPPAPANLALNRSEPLRSPTYAIYKKLVAFPNLRERKLKKLRENVDWVFRGATRQPAFSSGVLNPARDISSAVLGHIYARRQLQGPAVNLLIQTHPLDSALKETP